MVVDVLVLGYIGCFGMGCSLGDGVLWLFLFFGGNFTCRVVFEWVKHFKW